MSGTGQGALASVHMDTMQAALQDVFHRTINATGVCLCTPSYRMYHNFMKPSIRAGNEKMHSPKKQYLKTRSHLRPSQ